MTFMYSKLAVAQPFPKKHLYPKASVYDIELEETIAKMGKYMADIIPGDLENLDLPYAPHTFDYILFGDVLEHLRNPDKVLINMKKHLKSTGKIIASIPNLMHISVILPLLADHFTNANNGLLDCTHIHFLHNMKL